MKYILWAVMPFLVVACLHEPRGEISKKEARVNNGPITSNDKKSLQNKSIRIKIVTQKDIENVLK